jgi:hypothetical protein
MVTQSPVPFVYVTEPAKEIFGTKRNKAAAMRVV